LEAVISPVLMNVLIISPVLMNILIISPALMFTQPFNRTSTKPVRHHQMAVSKRLGVDKVEARTWCQNIWEDDRSLGAVAAQERH
jgi:hypothetical protein